MDEAVEDSTSLEAADTAARQAERRVMALVHYLKSVRSRPSQRWAHFASEGFKVSDEILNLLSRQVEVGHGRMRLS